MIPMSISRHACVMSMTRIIKNLPAETDLSSLEQDLKQALGCKTNKDFILSVIRLSSHIISLQSLNKLNKTCHDLCNEHNTIISKASPTSPANTNFTRVISYESIINISTYLNKHDSLILGMVSRDLYMLSQSNAYLMRRNDKQTLKLSPHFLVTSSKKQSNTFAFESMQNIHFVVENADQLDDGVNAPFAVCNKPFIQRLFDSQHLTSIWFQNVNAMYQLPLSMIFAKRSYLKYLKISNNTQHFSQYKIFTDIKRCWNEKAVQMIDWLQCYEPLKQCRLDKKEKESSNVRKNLNVCVIDTIVLDLFVGGSKSRFNPATRRDIYETPRTLIIRPPNVRYNNLIIFCDIVIKTKHDFRLLFHRNLKHLGLRTHFRNICNNPTRLILFEWKNQPPQAQIHGELSEKFAADCPKFKSMDLVIRSARKSTGGRVSIIMPKDDNQHPALENMLNNFYKFGICANIELLMIDNDPHDCTQKKFDVLLNCAIKKNVSHFPKLKRLYFKNKCQYIANYITENEHHLIHNTKISVITFQSEAKQYDVILFDMLSRLSEFDPQFTPTNGIMFVRASRKDIIGKNLNLVKLQNIKSVDNKSTDGCLLC